MVITEEELRRRRSAPAGSRSPAPTALSPSPQPTATIANPPAGSSGGGSGQPQQSGARDPQPAPGGSPASGGSREPQRERSTPAIGLPPAQDPQLFQRQAYSIPPPPKPPVYNAPNLSGAAPDFMAMANQLGSATAGPRYQTAAGSFQGENLLPELEAFAREGMAEPNRFLSDAVTSRREAFEAQADLSRDEAQAAVEELMASRGLTGSNFEVGKFSNIETELDQNRLDHMADLLEMMAEVESGDRAAALAGALSVGDFGRGLGNDRREEGQFQYGADRQRGRDLEDDRRTRFDADITAGQLDEDSRFREFEALLDAAGFESDQAFRNATLEEQGNIDRADQDLQRQELDLRAHEIQQQALTEGRQLSLEEARAQAAIELSSRELDIRQEEMEAARRHQELLELMGIWDLLQGGAPVGAGGIDIDQFNDFNDPLRGER